ncbi:MAG: FGGY family carbohydrate kinase [Spirochaetia bacterium]
MSARLIVGVDIGTQGVKGALFTEDGECVADHFVPSRLRQDKPGITEEDPEYQVQSVHEVISACIADAAADPGRIAAIAIDGQMAGIIGVDAAGVAVTPYDSWLDTRCAPYIARMEDAVGDLVLKKTGCPPSFNHGPKMLWCKHERPELFDRVHKFVQPGGYAAMRLCGLTGDEAFIDRTYLHFSGFADNQRGQWDDDLTRAFEFPVDKLPRICESTEIVGHVSADAARRTGMRVGTPVAAGCGDTIASFLACGAVSEGLCIDVAGTACVFAATVPEFRPDVVGKTLGLSASVVPDVWYAYAYVNGGGMNAEWFVKSFCKDLTGPDRFAALDAAAARIEETDSLPIFIPHMAGRVSPSVPELRGFFAGLTWSHDREVLYRAILEGVALEYGIYRRALADLFPDLMLTEMRATGGGSKSAVWNMMKSGVLGIPVSRVESPIGAPAGAAMVAAVAAGLHDGFETMAATWVEISGRESCPPERAGYYLRRVERYAALLDLVIAHSRAYPFEERT